MQTEIKNSGERSSPSKKEYSSRFERPVSEKIFEILEEITANICNKMKIISNPAMMCERLFSREKSRQNAARTAPTMRIADFKYFGLQVSPASASTT